MKREPPPKMVFALGVAYPHMPFAPVLSWTPCCYCEREIKFERMWEAHVHGPGVRGGWVRLCQSCAPRWTTDLVEVSEIFADAYGLGSAEPNWVPEPAPVREARARIAEAVEKVRSGNHAVTVITGHLKRSRP